MMATMNHLIVDGLLDTNKHIIVGKDIKEMDTLGNIELNKIYCCDCYQKIKEIPDKSIDLVIIDPPYELETRGAGFHKKRDYYDLIHDKGLAQSIDKKILNQLERIMKKTNIYIFCNKNQLPMYLDYYKNKNFDLLVWNKTNPIPTVNNKHTIIFIRY